MSASAPAKRSVSSAFENGRSRKVSVTGEVARNRREGKERVVE